MLLKFIGFITFVFVEVCVGAKFLGDLKLVRAGANPLFLFLTTFCPANLIVDECRVPVVMNLFGFSGGLLSPP